MDNSKSTMDKLTPQYAVCSLLGLFGGGWAYIHFDFLKINSEFFTQMFHYGWTCFLAFSTAVCGMLGKKLFDAAWPLAVAYVKKSPAYFKSLLKRKTKK